jgi:succinate-acetate transporter protein
MAQLATETNRAASAAPAFANPSPLGLCGFAMSTFVLSSINAGWFPPEGTNIIVGLAFFYGGIAQLITGILEFRVGNTFGVTAFTSYGAFWLALAFIYIPGTGILDALVKGAAVHPAVGLFLLGWTIFTGLLLLCSFRLNVGLVVTFALLFVALILLTIGELGPSTQAHQFGGYAGVLTAIAAWYVALAGLLSSVKFPFSLPVGPLS